MVRRSSTAQTHRTVEGVVAAVQGDGRYELSVYLIARPVNLAELADRVRAQIVAAVDATGLAAELGAVHVAVVGLLANEQLPEPVA